MPRRKVSVELELEAQRAIDKALELSVALEGTKTELDDLGDEATRTGKDLEKLAVEADIAKHEVDDLGDKARGTAVDMAALDQKIKAAKASVVQLSAEFANTGEKSVLKDLNAAKRALSALERTKKDLVTFAEEAAADIAAGVTRVATRTISDVVSGVVSKAASKALTLGKAHPLIAAIVALSPFLGAAISGAIVGAVGLGGIVGGIFTAIKDPRVRTAAGQFADNFKSDFFGGSDNKFAQPIVDSLKSLEREFQGLRLGDTFALAAPSVTTLAKGVSSFATNIMPGFTAVLGDSGPIIRAVSKGLGQLGTGISELLRRVLSSPGTLIGLADTFTLLEKSLEGLGSTLRFLSDLYQLLRPIAQTFAPVFSVLGTFLGMIDDAMQGWNALLERLQNGPQTMVLQPVTQSTKELQKAQTDLAFSLDAGSSGFEAVSHAGDRYRTVLQNLNKELNDYLETALAAAQADLGVKQGFADLSQTIRDNGRHWNDNSQAARDNQRAVLDQIAAIKQKRDTDMQASDQSKAALDKITRTYDAQLQKLLGLARQAGATKTELDKLSKTYFIDIQVRTTNIGTARAHAADQGDVIGHNAARVAAGSGRAAGGSVLAGRTYTVDEQRREQFTAGSQWQAPADGWVTPMLPPNAAQNSGGNTAPDGTTLGRAIRAALEGVAVMMDGRTVGTIQGRQSDLLARSF